MRFVSVVRIIPLIVFIIAVVSFAVSQPSSGGSWISHLYRVELSTGQVIADTYSGTRLQGAALMAAKAARGWSLAGIGNFGDSNGMVYFDAASGTVAVLSYRTNETEPAGWVVLKSPGANWIPVALADFNRDGHQDIVFVNKTTGEAMVYFYGGPRGTMFVRQQTIGMLSTTGWTVVGAADLNRDGHPDLILQNESGQVVAHYLGGADGMSVTATQDLGTYKGWTASGMQDMDGDGHPDLVLNNPATGRTMIACLGGTVGSTPLRSAYLENASMGGWTVIVPSGNSTTATANTSSATTSAMSVASQSSTTLSSPSLSTLSNTTSSITPIASSTVPVLIFNGMGTSSSDVLAVESVVTTAGYAYRTANSSQLDGMTQAQLAAYKLFIVPGGNSITIGDNLSSKATTNVHNAVAQNGLHYLGFCAGGFFGGFSKYNGLNLTSGVWFTKYPDSKAKDALWISFPAQSRLDIYWQDGPDLSRWGYVVGRYPNGHPAIVEGHWGNGFVLLTGVHPEAPASWRYGMTFGTPVDVDLAYARTLVKAAFNGTMLPHF